MKENLKTIIKEMIPVILGILIALLINEWKTSRDNEHFLDHVMTSISKEMKENLSELKEIIPEHENLADTLDHYLYDDEVSISDILLKVNGIQAISLKNTSWQSFLNPHIQLVDYEIISILTDVEEGKKHMSLQINSLISIIYPAIDSKEISKKKALRMLVGDLLYAEEELLGLHQKFLMKNENGR